LEALIELELVSETEYIASIELGNEIVDGQGKTIIKQYEINIFN